MREKLLDTTTASVCADWLHFRTRRPTFMTVSNIGMRTNLMNPIWAVGFVTLSLSMKGATGRPSDFSLSLWETVESG